MTIFSKLLAPAAVALCAVAALPAQAQVEGKIATVDISRAVLGTTAFQTAYEQVNTTYAQQNELRRTKAQERQTLLQSFDTNGDKQVDDAELAAKQNSPQFTQLQTLEQEIQALTNQIDAARVYAVEQVITQYGAALQEVVTKQQIKLVIDPATVMFTVPEADITQQITTALNAKVPSVGIVPPQGWQPARESVQLYQEIQQRLVAAQMMQQRQQQAQQQQQGNPQAPVGR
jgi:Skp family chaperone for outer membrane proteins